MPIFRFKRLLLGLFALPLVVACNEGAETTAASNHRSTEAEQLTVYKSPSCGCCTKWIDHIEAAGFATSSKHPPDLKAVKHRYHIEPGLHSCHTAVSSRGYIFEGHIPARYIHQFLDNPPDDALGLAVPAMPIGSPGMEIDNRFMPYQVLLINNDGSTEVFASVENPAQQYQTGDSQDVPL